MNALLAGQKLRWVVAATGAAVVLIALLFLFRLPPPPTGFSVSPSVAPQAAVKPAVQLATRADELLKAETDIRDLRPLFLPTERNASLPELKRELGRTFLGGDSVKSSFLESEIVVSKDLPPVAMVGDKPAQDAGPVDALASETIGASAFGFGRADTSIQPLEPRVGFVEVVSGATGERVLAEPLQIPEAKVPGDKPWAPLEFWARIDAAGLAAPLVVTTSSGVEEVDAHFRKFLAKTYRIGARLPPGFYRVIVAP